MRKSGIRSSVILLLWICLMSPTWLYGQNNVQKKFQTSLGTWYFLGETRFEKRMTCKGVEFGGLSGITYNPQQDIYYIISDDPGKFAPARFFTVKINLNDGHLDDGDVNCLGFTMLLDKKGGFFRRNSIDPEAIVWNPKGTLFISSEGGLLKTSSPFIREFTIDGKYIRDFKLPQNFFQVDHKKGIRTNLSLESLTLTPNGKYLFSANENALFQDGPQSDFNVASPVRILKFNTKTGRVESEYLYWVDPVAHRPVMKKAFRVNGLVELLALDDSTLIAMEREFSSGYGNSIKLYRVSLTDAEDIHTISALKDTSIQTIKAAQKELLLNLQELEIPLDNLEGMTFGPRLADGRRVFILVSDNNFNPGTQFTQFLAFAVKLNFVGTDSIKSLKKK